MVIFLEERGYIAERARLYSQKSAVILPEERGYIPGRARLYCRKSAVIFPEERGYIAGRARLYGGRARLYSRKSAVIFPEERGYIFVMKIVATFVFACSQGQRTHSARTNTFDSGHYILLKMPKNSLCTHLRDMDEELV